jgi:hypothetical protein
MRYCFYCGEELGCCAGYEPLDTCGKSGCEREARTARQRQIERDEAHEQLDKDGGWR